MEKKFLIVATVQEMVEGFLIPHIKLLESMGYQVWIAAKMDREIAEELRGNRWIDVDFSRNPFSKNSLGAVKELKKILSENQFQGIHCHTPVAAFLARFAGAITDQKNVMYTAHGFHFYRGAPVLNWMLYYPLEWLAAKWTDRIITMNREDFERAKTFTSEKTRVYRVDGVGVDIPKYSRGDGGKIRRELALEERDFIITIIGELNGNKNQIQLIKAVELLKKEGIESRVLIAGNGSKEEELKEYVKKNTLEKNIYFLGLRKDITDVIAASDILASMSYREGLPRNIMEGMAQGKPFVATDIRGNRDIIRDGINGYLVKPDDVAGTAQKIRVLMNREVAEPIKIQNLRDVNRFSIEKILEEMAKIYGENI